MTSPAEIAARLRRRGDDALDIEAAAAIETLIKQRDQWESAANGVLESWKSSTAARRTEIHAVLAKRPTSAS